MEDKIYILYTASYMDWKPAGKFKTLEKLKEHCVSYHGFPEEILTNDKEFNNWLDGCEMKFEII